MCKLRYSVILIGLTLMSSFALNAQQLDKEITVERDIVTPRPDVTKPFIRPVISLGKLNTANPQYASSPSNIFPKATFSTLSVSTDSSLALYHNLFPGYVIGFYTTPLAIDISTGYRFVSSTTTSVGASAYLFTDRRSTIFDNKRRETFAGIDIDAAHRFSSAATLAINADWQHSVIPAEQSRMYLYNRNYMLYNDFGISPSVSGQYRRLNYSANVGLNYSRFGTATFSSINDTEKYSDHETSYIIDGETSYDISTSSQTGLNIKYQNAIYSDERLWGFRRTLLSISPFIAYEGTGLYIRAGLSIHHSRSKEGLNEEPSTFVSPDINFSIPLSNRISIVAGANGYASINTLPQLQAISPYLMPNLISLVSRVKYDLTAGLRYGPQHGNYAYLYIGYSDAPYWTRIFHYDVLYMKTRNFRIGADASLSLGRYFEANANVVFIPDNKFGRSFYQFNDNARAVIDLSIKGHITRSLTLSASWNLRAQRKTFESWFYIGSSNEGKLGTVNDLGVEVSYKASQQLDLFIRGLNLLDRKWRDESEMYSRGIRASIGAAYKF